MNITQQYQNMRDNYEKLATQLMPAAQESAPVGDPVKLEWAKQEGFKPTYDPNSDDITWVRQPEPAYKVPDMMKLQGSMSPEALAEVYPMFGVKQQQVDPVLQKIFEAALNGEITHQRANELVFQLMNDVWDKLDKSDKKPDGAAAKSSSFSQTISKALKGQKVAGANQ